VDWGFPVGVQASVSFIGAFRFLEILKPKFLVIKTHTKALASATAAGSFIAALVNTKKIQKTSCGQPID
jgi:hypothetical protein